MLKLEKNLEKIEKHIYADYKKKTLKSKKLFSKLNQIMPGGVSGSFRYFAPYPFYIKSAEKSHIVDIDNNKYLDLFSGNGPLLLGHNNPKILKEVTIVLSEYSSKNELTFIIDQKNIIIGKSELNVTNKVLKLVDSRIKKVSLK